MSLTWKLLTTEPNNAAMNMAIDESILLAQKSRPQPTLRFFDWIRPAFSFGYFQQALEEVDMTACATHGIELVRRMTGGGTVIHGWDVTYTVIVPHGFGVLPKGIPAAYSVISDCLIRGLQRLDIGVTRQIEKSTLDDRPNVCLTNPAQYDIMLSGRKIAGVSQRRNQIGVMYQGYIALDMPPPDILALASKRPNFDRILGQKSTAINEERDTPIDRQQLKSGVTAGFAEVLGIRLMSDTLSGQEVETAKSLSHTKYTTAEWNFRR
ncbi:MAG: biotin/lipoate A/B protein ligase family protein [Candidatus Poribacteria bacterium]|nr:biotin/lipoate A/B protein ligase family protein [Candidatus Poribacteria bacterium]